VGLIPLARARLIVIVTAAMLLAGCTTSAKPAPAPPPASRSAAVASAATACGTTTTTPTYTHVVWIWMENKNFSSVIGQPQAPYENALANGCGLATNFHAITHPSPPNYLAATAGATLGVNDDKDPKSHQLSADSIFGQLDSAGLTWRAYEESMPKNCDLSSSGRYIARHNPAAYFTAVRSTCATNDVPLDGNLQRDIDAGSLPSFTFITPNRCDDGHSCSSTIAGEVTNGDNWLATWIPRLIAGPNYQAGNTLIVLTWDENEGGATNLIPTIVVGPSVQPGTKSATVLNQYSLLRTTEDLLHLPALGGAKTATSMSDNFHL
jgi:hypothetical protein